MDTQPRDRRVVEPTLEMLLVLIGLLTAIVGTLAMKYLPSLPL